jgi:hypothetical protein
MSIKVSCTVCPWTGTVADELAGETIACRACAAPVPVPAEVSDDGMDFEVVDGDEARPKAPDGDAIPLVTDERAAAAMRALKLIAEKKKRSPFWDRPWLIPPKVITIVGVLILVAGVLFVALDAAFNQSHVYSFVLLGVGSFVALSGYMFDQMVKP